LQPKGNEKIQWAYVLAPKNFTKATGLLGIKIEDATEKSSPILPFPNKPLIAKLKLVRQSL
jgi:hypothetical protein